MSIEEIINHLDVLARVGEGVEGDGSVRDINGANAVALREAIALLQTHHANVEILKKYSEATDGIGLKRLREITQAEKDGRLVVLPCKVTDTVYIVESIMKGKKHIGEKVVSAQIDHVTIGGSKKPVLDVCSETGNWYIALEDGEFWITRREAETALREEADNETD